MTNEEKKTAGPILVAIDFSADSAAALAWALRYADLEGRRLVLLHVVHEPASRPGFYRDSKRDLLQPLEAVAREMMNQFLQPLLLVPQHASALGRAERLFIQGLPPTRIVEVAERLAADPIVVGSRGRTGLPHVLLGSVAERVVELAPCPVVVVKSLRKDEDTEKQVRRAAKIQEKERKPLEKMLGRSPAPAVNRETDD